jgi:hypothetical protein
VAAAWGMTDPTTVVRRRRGGADGVGEEDEVALPKHAELLSE